jgi:hypothetical protein
MKITKDAVIEKGFLECDYMGGKAYSKTIARETYLRFGGQFNGALELEFPDGNDGTIILTPNTESWEDVAILERLFSKTWIDTGHTITSNFGEFAEPEVT